MHAVRWLASPRQGKSSQREGNALFDDFWYFSSVKSARKKEKLSLCFFVPTATAAAETRKKRSKIDESGGETSVFSCFLPGELIICRLFAVFFAHFARVCDRAVQLFNIDCAVAVEHGRLHRYRLWIRRHRGKKVVEI